MCDVDELRLGLRSDKITIRKKARAECENKLFSDRAAIAGNVSQTMGLLVAIVDYEKHEINAAHSKDKSVDMAVSTFFRSMVKYCVSHGQINSRKLHFFFQHTLAILCSDELPNSYKNNHKNCLCWILQPVSLHSISFDESLKDVIIYVRDTMSESKALQDSLNHKLLRAVCRCMYMDRNCDPQTILYGVTNWFRELLQRSSEDSTLHATITATTAECCAYFVKYQSFNVLNHRGLRRNLLLVFQSVVKHVASYQHRDQHRDMYFGFLDYYLLACQQYLQMTHCSPVSNNSSVGGANISGNGNSGLRNQIHPTNYQENGSYYCQYNFSKNSDWDSTLSQLCEVFLSEGYLRHLAHSSSISGGSISSSSSSSGAGAGGSAMSGSNASMLNGGLLTDISGTVDPNILLQRQYPSTLGGGGGGVGTVSLGASSSSSISSSSGMGTGRSLLSSGAVGASVLDVLEEDIRSRQHYIVVARAFYLISLSSCHMAQLSRDVSLITSAAAAAATTTASTVPDTCSAAAMTSATVSGSSAVQVRSSSQYPRAITNSSEDLPLPATAKRKRSHNDDDEGEEEKKNRSRRSTAGNYSSKYGIRELFLFIQSQQLGSNPVTASCASGTSTSSKSNGTGSRKQPRIIGSSRASNGHSSIDGGGVGDTIASASGHMQPRSSNSNSNKTQFTTTAASAAGKMPPAINAVSRQNLVYLCEGAVTSVAALCILYPRGEFLFDRNSNDVRSNTNHDIHTGVGGSSHFPSIQDWTVLLFVKLQEVEYVLPAESQLIGSLLIALNRLCNLSGDLLRAALYSTCTGGTAHDTVCESTSLGSGESNGPHTHQMTPGASKALVRTWVLVLDYLLSNASISQRTGRNAYSCRHKTIGSLVMQLISTILLRITPLSSSSFSACIGDFGCATINTTSPPMAAGEVEMYLEKLIHVPEQRTQRRSSTTASAGAATMTTRMSTGYPHPRDSPSPQDVSTSLWQFSFWGDPTMLSDSSAALYFQFVSIVLHASRDDIPVSIRQQLYSIARRIHSQFEIPMVSVMHSKKRKTTGTSLDNHDGSSQLDSFHTGVLHFTTWCLSQLTTLQYFATSIEQQQFHSDSCAGAHNDPNSSVPVAATGNDATAMTDSGNSSIVLKTGVPALRSLRLALQCLFGGSTSTSFNRINSTCNMPCISGDMHWFATDPKVTTKNVVGAARITFADADYGMQNLINVQQQLLHVQQGDARSSHARGGTGGGLSKEASEHFNAWHIISMANLSGLAGLLESVSISVASMHTSTVPRIDNITGTSNPNTEMQLRWIDAVYFPLLEAFLQLVKAVASQLETTSTILKIALLTEYLELLSLNIRSVSNSSGQLLHTISSASESGLGVCGEPSISVDAQRQKRLKGLRAQCIRVLTNLGQEIESAAVLSTRNGRGVRVSNDGASDDDDGFDDIVDDGTSSHIRGSSHSRNKTTSANNHRRGSIQAKDDDFLDGHDRLYGDTSNSYDGSASISGNSALVLSSEQRLAVVSITESVFALHCLHIDLSSDRTLNTTTGGSRSSDATAVCKITSSSLDQIDNVVEKTMENMLSVNVNGVTVRLTTNTEYQFLFAQCLLLNDSRSTGMKIGGSEQLDPFLCVQSLYLTSAVLGCITRATPAWQVEWGALGFAKILTLIHQLFQSHAFWQALLLQHQQTLSGDGRKDESSTMLLVEFGLETPLSVAVGLILPGPDDDALLYYLSNFWLCRQMQLKCLSALLQQRRCVDLNAVKNDVRDVFLAALVDAHIVVRQTAASLLHLVIPQFKNKLKVYDALIEASALVLVPRTASAAAIAAAEGLPFSPLSQQSNASSSNNSSHSREVGEGSTAADEEEEDAGMGTSLEVVALARGIATMGSAMLRGTMPTTSSSSSDTVSITLMRRAIFDLCRLCITRHKYAQNMHAQSYARSQGNRRDDGAGLGASITVAVDINYSHLLQEQLHVLGTALDYPLVSLMMTDQARWLLNEWLQLIEQNNNLTLRDIPYQLLELCRATSQQQQQQQQQGEWTYQKFLRVYGAELITCISLLPPASSQQSKLLIEYTTDAGYLHTTSGCTPTTTGTGTGSSSSSSSNDQSNSQSMGEAIALLVKEHICSIKAMELTLLCASTLRRSNCSAAAAGGNGGEDEEREMAVADKALAVCANVRSFIVRANHSDANGSNVQTAGAGESSRVLKDSLGTFMPSQSTDLLLGCLRWQMAPLVSDCEHQGGTQIHTVEGVYALLDAVFAQVASCTGIGESRAELFNQSNMLFVFNTVHASLRRCKTQQLYRRGHDDSSLFGGPSAAEAAAITAPGSAAERSILTALAVVQLWLEVCVETTLQLNLLQSVVSLLQSCLCLSPRHFGEIVRAWRLLVNVLEQLLCMEEDPLLQLGSADAAALRADNPPGGNGRVQQYNTAPAIRHVLPDVFAEILVLLKAAAMHIHITQVNNNPITATGNSSSTGAGSSSKTTQDRMRMVQRLQEQGVLDVKSTQYDAFVASYLSTLAHSSYPAGMSSSKSSSSIDTAMGREVVILHSLIKRLMEKCASTNNHCLLSPLLPLPMTLHRNCFEPSYSTYRSTLGAGKLHVTQRMYVLIHCVQLVLRGVLVPLSSIWLQLQIISDELTGSGVDHDNEAMDTAAGEVTTMVNISNEQQQRPTSADGVHCHWDNHVDLISSFLSSLIGLCRHIGATSEKQQQGPVSPALLIRQQVLQLVGHFGAPDMLALDHAQFPALGSCNIMRSAVFAPDWMKWKIIVSVYGILWDQDDIHARSDPSCSSTAAEGVNRVEGAASSDPTSAYGVEYYFDHQRRLWAAHVLRKLGIHKCFSELPYPGDKSDNPRSNEGATIAGGTSLYGSSSSPVYDSSAKEELIVKEIFDTFSACSLTPTEPPYLMQTSLRDEDDDNLRRAGGDGGGEEFLFSAALWSTHASARTSNSASADATSGASDASGGASGTCTDNSSSDYERWVCRLSYHLIDLCYVAVPPQPSEAGVEEPNAEGNANANNSSSQSCFKSRSLRPVEDNFMICIKPLCLLHKHIAESVFPLVIYDILRVNGPQSFVQQSLSRCLATYVLSPNCRYLEATQLGCQLLLFLMRQDMKDFMQQSTVIKSRNAPPKTESSKTAAQDWLLPFSFVLNIDYKYAAEAATRCQLICTALLFTELSHEVDSAGDNSSENNESGNNSNQNQRSRVEFYNGDMSATGTGTGTGAVIRGGRGGIIPVSSPVHGMLLPIYQGIHDPDALSGIDLSSTLPLQAVMFSHQGKWLEALTTYEGIFQAQQQQQGRMVSAGTSRSTGSNSWSGFVGCGPHMSRAAADMGIAASLSALGAKHTLEMCHLQDHTFNSFGQTGVGDVSSLSALSQWDDQLMATAADGSSACVSSSPNDMTSSSSFSATASSFVSWSVDTALRYTKRGDFPAAASRVQACSKRLFEEVLVRMTEETAVNVLPYLAKAQQLTEITEVAKWLGSTGSSNGSGIDRSNLAVAKLLKRWQQHPNGSSSGSGSHRESQFELRTGLLEQLLLRDKISPFQAMGCLTMTEANHRNNSSSNSSNNNHTTTTSAHALTPSVYKFWYSMVNLLDNGSNPLPQQQHQRQQRYGTQLPSIQKIASQRTLTVNSRNSSSSSSSSNIVNDANEANVIDGYNSMLYLRDSEQQLLQAEWAFFECRLLWMKGLKDASISNLSTRVIHSLKRLNFELQQQPQQQQQQRKINGTYSGTGGIASRVQNLLSDALCTGGEWVSTKRAATGTGILDDYLLPAAAYASGIPERIRTHSTLARFHARLYQNLLARVTSPEWSLGARVLADRRREYQECRVLQDKMRRATTPTAGPPPIGQEARTSKKQAAVATGATVQVGGAYIPVDAKALFRHVVTLKKEIDLDAQERANVEQSVQRYLLAAVTDLIKVLELSSEADVETVFHLVQLWLSNSDNAQVNALIDDALRRVPSYKFVPLSYQILSRLGGADDQDSAANSAQSQARLAEQLREFSQHHQLPQQQPSSRSSSRNGDPALPPPLSRATTLCSTFSAGGAAAGLMSVEDDSGPSAGAVGGGMGVGMGDGSLPFEGDFQLVLCKMVIKLSTDHPHHILPQLFALAHERDFGGKYDGAAHVKKNLSRSRWETSKMLVDQLKAIPNMQHLVNSTQRMLLAYIDLANASTAHLQKSGRTKGIKYKEMQPRGRRFNEVMQEVLSSTTTDAPPAVLTISIPLSPVGDYHQVVRVCGYQPAFSITDTGISRPKIMQCIGSDGRNYTELVKGGDDMRQDAVMQQVFENVNYTLGRDDETQKRQLRVFTYKIVPLTPQTGILQWVSNTTAFGSVLTDRGSGSHDRYYPNDWTHYQCRQHLNDATDNQNKLERFQEICRKFHPSFRFFFLEKYADPVRWMGARLAYSRSVAVNSIIGYILGIGDRHAQNILLNTVTAEVVHIDFGIVFEQGKGLGTPETVPFRLTRDIVDAMGITGCEGSFRRACEEVLRVLRAHALQIMTILEVVIHDPLYKWSLSPLQARQKQNTLPDYHNDWQQQQLQQQQQVPQDQNNSLNSFAPATNATNGYGGMRANTAGFGTTAGGGGGGGSFGRDAAQRTLRRVLQKLQGQEDPSSGEPLSVEGQVDLLINEARSEDNLSRLFPGWAPWL